MNKKNLGYHIGKLYLKFRQWQHPAILKWLYVLIMGAIGIVFWEFVLCVFIIVFITTLPDHSEKKYQHAVRERARFMQDVHKQMVKDGYERVYGYTKKYDDNLMGSGNGTGNGINL